MISIEAGTTADSATELLVLLDRLRAQTGREDVPKREVIDDNLNLLADDMRALQRGVPGTAHPELTLSRWSKVQSLLGGRPRFAPLVSAISSRIEHLFR
ncbi:hypothetical protein [Amycolatopsis magusensis]|uniref:Uncharacterized protein n=1 Tax=Amycolatopsis magusensis TaxID=882444 RepID=A0ABS4PPM8_9PSEU|nr:hypothetical protein [Amycolatopsis magusensis]MBP2181367.1 hypothetical protein [Amycolatopsis magusensis]MDI5975165.1 hypothetical protein [Amycolatopsis magusensis]